MLYNTDQSLWDAYKDQCDQGATNYLLPLYVSNGHIVNKEDEVLARFTDQAAAESVLLKAGFVNGGRVDIGKTIWRL